MGALFRLTKGLVYGQVCLDCELGGGSNLLVVKHMATSFVQHTVDSSLGLFRALKTAGRCAGTS